MNIRWLGRLLAEPDRRVLGKFLWNFGWQGLRAVNRFKRQRDGACPAFLFISPTNRCNLACQGCWVTQEPGRDLTADQLRGLLDKGRAAGVRFFGILGGEPLLCQGLIELLAGFADCYFLLFTNGLALTPAAARALRQAGNISPLISVEGIGAAGDERRGGRDVYGRALAALAACRDARLIFGVATSVCRSNLETLATPEFAAAMARAGAHYLWYYLYRPAGPNPCPELALDAAQIRGFRRFLVELRVTAPLLVVDAYWDHEGRALCPAATGLAYHINPAGDLEPCPVIQFAKDNLLAAPSLRAACAGSEFLRAFRRDVPRRTRGCIFLDDPAWLADWLAAHGARDATGRDGWGELRAKVACPSHHQPGAEIPERDPLIRLAKRRAFFGFAGYG